MLWRLRRAARIRGRFRRAGWFFCGGREKTVGAIRGLRGVRPADAAAAMAGMAAALECHGVEHPGWAQGGDRRRHGRAGLAATLRFEVEVEFLAPTRQATGWRSTRRNIGPAPR